MSFPNILCPRCGQPAQETTGAYGIRHDCKPCGLHGWNGKRMVDAANHMARQEAHRYFDPLWKGTNKIMERSEAYRLLARSMGLQPRDCHIGRMNTEQALSVSRHALAIRKERQDA